MGKYCIKWQQKYQTYSMNTNYILRNKLLKNIADAPGYPAIKATHQE